MSSLSNLISSYGLRINRKQQKFDSVLRFLRHQIWSSQEILQCVMKLETRQAAHKSLCQMQEEGLVRSHKYCAIGGCITLWGITAHGQSMAFRPDSEEHFSTYFEPMRISELMIRHQLDLQRLRVAAETHGWSDWQDGDRLGALNKDTKRPDAIAKAPSKKTVAVECERTFKTVKRYEQILVSYLKLLKSAKVAEVVWVLPNMDMVLRLKKIILSIKTVRVAGQKVQIEPEKHHAHLHFCSYSDWPKYE